jgi:hypothetical protein
MSSDAKRLRSLLRHFRRRAFFARLANGLAFYSLIGLTVLVLTRGERALEILAVVGAAGLGSAFLGTPTLWKTARDVDRRANLEQRLETAFELQEDPEPVSKLVVKDALRAIEDLRAADLFPIRISSDRWTLSAFALLTIALFRAALPTGSAGGGFRLVSAPASALDAPAFRLEDSPDVPGGEAGGGLSGEESAGTAATPPTPSASTARQEGADPGGEEIDETPATFDELPPAEWIAIEGLFDLPLAGGSSPSAGGGMAAGGAASTEGGAEGENGASAATASIRSGSSELVAPPVASDELPIPRERIPPGLRDYVRAYFARLSGAR